MPLWSKICLMAGANELSMTIAAIKYKTGRRRTGVGLKSPPCGDGRGITVR
jgi:hypothetical protein